MNVLSQLTLLPGGDLLAQSLEDAAAHRVTAAACLVCVARSRLRACGVAIPEDFRINDPEHTLYRILGSEPGDAYSRYNALIRRLISFSQALEQQVASQRVTQSLPS